MTVPYALSVHTFIKNVGADAGFASIIGLAVLILLYFAQMRETSTLRDHLEETLGRVQQLENRVAHLARSLSAATSAPAARPGQPAVAPRPVVPLRSMGSAVATLRTHPGNAVNASVQPRPVPVLAGPPAGFAAPALGSATKLIPTPAFVEPDAVPAGAPTPVPAPAPAGPAAPAATPTPVAAPGIPMPVGAAPSGSLGAAQTQAGATATLVEDTVLIAGPDAAAANGHEPFAPPVLGPPTPPPPPAAPLDATVVGSLPDPDDGGAAHPPRVHIGRGRGAGVPRRTAALPRSDAPRQPSLARRLVLALIGLALVAAIVVVLVSVTGGAKQKPPARTTGSRTQKSHKPRHHTAAVFNPANVTVAVLNGTGTYHLAQDVANKLTSRGYKEGAVTNAPLQTQTSTVIGYLPGHQTAADQVAVALNLSSAAVQQASQPAIVACAAFTSGGSTSTSSSCPADVIVTVGADLSTSATGTTTKAP